MKMKATITKPVSAITAKLEAMRELAKAHAAHIAADAAPAVALVAAAASAEAPVAPAPAPVAPVAPAPAPVAPAAPAAAPVALVAPAAPAAPTEAPAAPAEATKSPALQQFNVRLSPGARARIKEAAYAGRMSEQELLEAWALTLPPAASPKLPWQN